MCHVAEGSVIVLSRRFSLTSAARRSAGVTIVYALIAMTALVALVSLAVDLGRVQLAKTELTSAADAAARAGAASIMTSASQARANAIAIAAANNVDTTPLTLSNADIEVGRFAYATFTVNGTPNNAVRVTASRTAAAGNAIPMLFASILGRNSCDIHVSSVARNRPAVIYGFIGLDGFDVQNNLFSGSYDSTVTTSPDTSDHSDTGMIGSNVSITAKNNEVVDQVVLGSGATQNLNLTKPPIVLPGQIPTPTMDFSGAPASNPGGVSTTLNVSGTTTLPGGTYYFTSISVGNGGKLTFSGPATLYVDGNIDFTQGGNLDAYGMLPANLKIRQRGAGTTFSSENSNQLEVVADIDAPETAFTASNSASLYGRAIFKTIVAKNNIEFYYDEALEARTAGYGDQIALVK